MKTSRDTVPLRTFEHRIKETIFKNIYRDSTQILKRWLIFFLKHVCEISLEFVRLLWISSNLAFYKINFVVMHLTCMEALEHTFRASLLILYIWMNWIIRPDRNCYRKISLSPCTVFGCSRTNLVLWKCAANSKFRYSGKS